MSESVASAKAFAGAFIISFTDFSSPANSTPHPYDAVHRVFAAFFAISERLSAESDVARAVPPFNPPARPRRVGFLFESLTESSTSPLAMSTTIFASWLKSRGRLAIFQSCHIPRLPATSRQFKLRHYRRIPAFFSLSAYATSFSPCSQSAAVELAQSRLRRLSAQSFLWLKGELLRSRKPLRIGRMEHGLRLDLDQQFWAAELGLNAGGGGEGR